MIPIAIVVCSSVLLIAGAPIRRRCLRHIHRDGTPPILEKERGQVSIHWFMATSPLLQ
ncbi:hypothetical protein [Streptomyces sp. NBC_00102]|uniref:hypothetical protein n=1 Tax=Streptomyces sp. NBC_00102 TaxID=2975652 RepID=UPI002250081E|nr:hypothetical protein [Streptomyces sp. NBC_00102]MCX5401416.1 hypothetical protein [Streptomyces sp. NBC_00102]